MNTIIKKSTQCTLGLALFIGLSASVSAYGGWHGGGWHGGGWHGGGWNGGGWYGGTVIVGYPNYYNNCGAVRVCDGYGSCWIQRSCY